MNFRVEGRPVIHLVLDGTRADVFYSMMDAGELPNIRRYVGDRGLRVENAFTSLTSTTFACIAVQLSGKVPAHLNFPGNAWLDRDTSVLRKINSSASVLRINTDITGPTLPEILAAQRPREWSAVIADNLTRGAAYANPLREWLGVGYFLQRWRIVDRFAFETFHDILIEANKRGTFPAYAFVHLIATDNHGHMHGPLSRELRDCLKHEDAQFGRLMRTFDAMGLTDKVCVLITADHGMMALEPQSLVLRDFISNSMGVPCGYLAVEEDMPIEKRRAALSKYRALDATSGDRYCFLYFSSPDKAGVADWGVRPSLDQLRRFRNDAGKSFDVPDLLRSQPGVAFVCARDEKGVCHVYGPKGYALVHAEGAVPKNRRYAYGVKEGQDPLGYQSVPLRSTGDMRFHTADEWFEATANSEYPNFVPEVYDLFDSARTGDLVLFAAPGWNFKSGNKGAHGGPHRDEMRVPMLMAGPGIPRRAVSRARTADIVPTVLDYMGVSPGEEFDGRSLLAKPQ